MRDGTTPARPRLERRALQVAVALGGLVPVSAGLAGAIAGPSFVDAGQYTMSVDSHVRYLSGLLLGIGLCFWGMIPTLERRTAVFRMLTAIVVIGGLARLAGLASTGIPSAAMLAGLGMELVVTPALCLWQGRVARLHAAMSRAMRL